jgi:integrase
LLPRRFPAASPKNDGNQHPERQVIACSMLFCFPGGMKMPKLTKTLVSERVASDKEAIIWDTEVIGFGLRIRPSGSKTFIFSYRSPEGRTLKSTIGKPSDVLTVEQARQIAKDRMRDVLNGRDPQGEKKTARLSITVNDMLDDYIKSEAFLNKAATTRATDLGRIDRHIRPLLGNEFAGKLTQEAVMKAHRAIAEGKTAGKTKTKARGLARVTGGKGTADKSALILSAAYKWAIAQRIAKTNPAAGIGAGKTGQRDTVLENSDDYARLFTTLQTMEDQKRIRQAAADGIRFIALTGARRGEATGLLWKYVDMKAGQIVLPPTAHKTGHATGKPRIIALPAEAQAIIARQPAGKPDDYVFRPSKGAGAIALAKPWQMVRAEAGLPANLGLHGLRHSIATHLAVAGASAVELMETLGHKQISTTLRYIHFAESARSTLAERAAAVAMAGLNGTADKADVVELKPRKKA